MNARIALLAALAIPLGLSAMPTAVESPVSLITFKQAVRLGDGSVLPAGSYDVKIDFRGWGNAAELHFFQRGVLKGKTPAVVRGFPSQPPPVPSQALDKKYQKADEAGVKIESSDAKLAKVVPPGDDKIKIQDKWQPTDKPWLPPGAPQTFSWGAHGFTGAPGKVTPAGPGQVKLVLDSTNSAAGFSAILPFIEKGRK